MKVLSLKALLCFYSTNYKTVKALRSIHVVVLEAVNGKAERQVLKAQSKRWGILSGWQVVDSPFLSSELGSLANITLISFNKFWPHKLEEILLTFKCSAGFILYLGESIHYNIISWRTCLGYCYVLLASPGLLSVLITCCINFGPPFSDVA